MTDYEAMTDLEIKQYKTKLYWLRQEATPKQDRELRDEMIRAQAVINERSRARSSEYQRIAAETPGAVSTVVTGAISSAGTNAPASGE
jgi:hypothetical protein